jgi:Sugar (and other) transporter
MPLFGWRWLVALSSLPSFLLLVFFKSTSESPRYLFKEDKTDEAMLVLKKIALMNETSLPPGVLGSNYLKEDYASSSNVELSESSPLIKTKGRNGLKVFLNLLSPKLVRFTLLLWLVFFGNAFGYYGVVLLTSELSGRTGKCNSNLTKQIHLQNDASLYRDVFLTSIAGKFLLLVSMFVSLTYDLSP